MKRITSLLIAGCLLSLASFAATPASTQTADDYFVNDQKIETLFSGSQQIDLSITTEAMVSGTAKTNSNQAFFAPSDKNFATALLLNFFLGPLGIHRLYLGTKTLTWVGYILTCGGIFGIVPLIDLIVLIVHNDDISPYVNNPKFFMWANGAM
ncbi:MAG: TM2 domain-containing protein [Chitinophagaceae bacterium]